MTHILSDISVRPDFTGLPPSVYHGLVHLTNNAAALLTIEQSLNFIAGASLDPNTVSVNPLNANNFLEAAYSKAGTCFYIWDNQGTGGNGTQYAQALTRKDAGAYALLVCWDRVRPENKQSLEAGFTWEASNVASESSRTCCTRARFTHGSKYTTSTNLAPRR